MEAVQERYDALLCSAAQRLRGAEHRSFIAEVTQALCDGSCRRAERQFGWGRQTIEKGLNYRLKRIQKGKPLKKTKDTDAIFNNVRTVHEQSRLDPETLEISVDTKAKVSLGEYSRGGKNPD